MYEAGPQGPNTYDNSLAKNNVVITPDLWGSCLEPDCIWSQCGDTRRRSALADLLRAAMLAPDGESAISLVRAVFTEEATPVTDTHSIDS